MCQLSSKQFALVAMVFTVILHLGLLPATVARLIDRDFEKPEPEMVADCRKACTDRFLWTQHKDVKCKDIASCLMCHDFCAFLYQEDTTTVKAVCSNYTCVSNTFSQIGFDLIVLAQWIATEIYLETALFPQRPAVIESVGQEMLSLDYINKRKWFLLPRALDKKNWTNFKQCSLSITVQRMQIRLPILQVHVVVQCGYCWAEFEQWQLRRYHINCGSFGTMNSWWNRPVTTKQHRSKRFYLINPPNIFSHSESVIKLNN